METLKVKIAGMNCNHCKINVERQLLTIQGIRVAIADLQAGEVTVKGDRIDLGEVRSAVESIGYSFDGKVT